MTDREGSSGREWRPEGVLAGLGWKADSRPAKVRMMHPRRERERERWDQKVLSNGIARDRYGTAKRGFHACMSMPVQLSSVTRIFSCGFLSSFSSSSLVLSHILVDRFFL